MSVQLAVSPKWARVPEQPALKVVVKSARSVVPAAPSVIEYATPAETPTSVLPAQSSGSPTFESLRFTWKRSPACALPPGQALVTVTFGAALRVFVIVQLAVSPKCASVPEHPALDVVV